MYSAKIWKVKVKNPSKVNPEWLSKVLAENRGLSNEKKMHDFLNPTLEQVLGVKLSQLKQGINRVEQAISNKEKIVVYSDYDADGITASAIMWETLNDLGANVMPYVPHRIKEGYGLAIPAIEELAKQGITLIVTVDHGVTAVKQIEAAKKLKVDVVVTDHHVMPKIGPKPYAMVHSTELCGAGVAWLFCYHLVSKIEPEYLEKLLEKLELAAIATIADLVPLNAASRAIVKIGLEKLNKTKRPGIKCLLSATGTSGAIGTYEIGHVIAPKINAMGRIEHGLDALRLVCAKNQNRAQRLAALLVKTNSKRQELTSGAIDSAFAQVREDQLVGVVASRDWHEGVIGLVASRLVERHYKPMIVISRGETRSKGSARSIAGFNIIEAIRGSSEFLVDAGGHPMAAGFTIETKHIENFTKKINVYAQTALTEDLLVPKIEIDCVLSGEDLNQNSLRIIKKFEPFGVANPEPTFLLKSANLEDIQAVGNVGQHLKLLVEGKTAMWFNNRSEAAGLRPGDSVDIVFTLSENHYNGQTSLQLKIKDLKQIN